MRVVVAWSSGKDSAYALHVLKQRTRFEVVGLLTTLNAARRRVSMHGVREEVLEVQAKAAGLPLHKVLLPEPCTDEDYRAAMAAAIARLEEEGVQGIAFGDIFLEDVRKYREAQLSGTRLVPVFPLWGRSTAELASEMLGCGIEAVITCVDTGKLPGQLAGNRYDQGFITALPPRVDPCGENGEFHTVVVAGPMFTRALDVIVRGTVTFDQFVYADVVIAERGGPEPPERERCRPAP